MKVNCETPITIFNPLLNELVAVHKNLHINGLERKFINPKNLYYAFNPSKILPSPDSVPVASLDNYYISNSVTCETYPVYIQVPCGHCEVCKNAKVNAFVDRCKLETQLYNSNPLFITLTYDDIHRKQEGVSVRDIQLFLKRLRINLYRKGYRKKIRYAVVSEYGRRTARPHYHGILWNLHQTDFLSYLEIRALIEKSWSNGFVMCRLVDPSDDKAFFYTAKYLRKDCNVPEGCNNTFMVCSNRGGAIGAAFIDRIRDHAVKHLNTEIKYVNKWNGRVFNVQTNRYMLNRLVPSLSHSLPYSLKKRVRRFIYDFHCLDCRDNVNTYLFDLKLKSYVNFFSRYFYVPTELSHNVDIRSNESILREMLQDEIYIDNAMSKGDKFYHDAVYFADRREKYLLKLFANVVDVNISDKVYKIKRFNALAAEREIF